VQKAIELVKDHPDQQFLADLASRLKLYRTGKPFREPR
jgi:hypothetical protein